MGPRKQTTGWMGGTVAAGLALLSVWGSASLGRIVAQRAAEVTPRRMTAPLARLNAVAAQTAPAPISSDGSELSVPGTGQARMSHHWTAEPTNDQRTTYQDYPRTQADAPLQAKGSDAHDATPTPHVPPVGPWKVATR